MKHYFKTVLKIKSSIVLLFFSLFCLALSFIRILISKDFLFLFLIWNLFLAFIPWFLSSILMICDIKKTTVFFIILAVWIFFFPNAPYILTDIIHLKIAAPKYRWIDLILILSYTFCGLFYGFTSLFFTEKALVKMLKVKHPLIFSVIILYLAGFGIYLGRFLRWNSWDLVANLQKILCDVFDRVANPFEHWQVWAFTFALGTLLNLLYLTYRSFNPSNQKLNIRNN
ncbi:MAG: hypothetical protein CR988_01170 [Treponema sp.]|nr:MAG: hypothetical protein CR988_01170 [Treponema sp.]